MLTYDCDVTLPTAQRFASLKFGRIMRNPFMVYDDAVELTAFLQIVPKNCARHIFKWPPHIYNRLDQLSALADDARPLHDANLHGQTAEDGLAILRAMQDGGWRYGGVPEITKNALRHLWDAGYSHPEIGRLLNLTVDQVRVMIHGRRTNRQGHTTALLIG